MSSSLAIDYSLLVVITLQGDRILTGPSEVLESVAGGRGFASASAAEVYAASKRADQAADNREIARFHLERVEAALRAMTLDDADSSDAIPSITTGDAGYAYTFAVMTIAEWAERLNAEKNARDAAELSGLVSQLGVRGSAITTDLPALAREIERRRHPIPSPRFPTTGSTRDRARQRENYEVVGHPAYVRAKRLIAEIIAAQQTPVHVFAGLLG